VAQSKTAAALTEVSSDYNASKRNDKNINTGCFPARTVVTP